MDRHQMFVIASRISPTGRVAEPNNWSDGDMLRTCRRATFTVDAYSNGHTIKTTGCITIRVLAYEETRGGRGYKARLAVRGNCFTNGMNNDRTNYFKVTMV